MSKMDILKAILINAGKGAVATIPGGGAVVGAAESIVKASTGAEKGEAAVETLIAAIAVLEQTTLIDFADEPEFLAAFYALKVDAVRMVNAVKNHKPTAPPVAQ
jgi:hypothetical protein